jgi:hypothetical protein
MVEPSPQQAPDAMNGPELPHLALVTASHPVPTSQSRQNAKAISNEAGAVRFFQASKIAAIRPLTMGQGLH